MSTSPIVHLPDVTLVARPPEHCPQGEAAERFDCHTARLTGALGLHKLGCNVTQVAPGRAAYPFHSHRANDELFLVLAGEGVLRFGAARHAVRPGDLIGCPAGGPSQAHQLVNTGSVPLRYLAVATRIDPEICEYPDSAKIAAYHRQRGEEFVHITRAQPQADYWDGE
jgi:uncharacterized cupin superfamily protein